MDEFAPIEACMRIVKPLVEANDLNGLPTAERAMFTYLATRVGESDRLLGVGNLEDRLGEIDEAMHPAKNRNFLELLTSFLEARRRFAGVE